MLAKLSARLVKWIEWLIRIFEIILSVFLIIGVVSAGLMLVFSLQSVFVSATSSAFQQFLDNALLYIIGLEVALMLIKRDPHLVVDILIFAIARKMIVTMESGIDFFLGALAILLLYVVKCYGISCILLPRQLWANLTRTATGGVSLTHPENASTQQGPSSTEHSTSSTEHSTPSTEDHTSTERRTSFTKHNSNAPSMEKSEQSTNS